MSLVAWNCCGSGGRATIPNLARVLQSTKACLAFVSETKCGTKKATRRIKKLPLKNHEVVPSVGSSGGLWLLWDDMVQVKVIERSVYFIFAEVKLIPSENPWLLGAIYGDPHDTVTEYIWDRIVHYSTSDPRPLCVIGDFNSIYAPFEKFGGTSRVKRKHRLFQTMITTSGLLDLGYHGPAYTWTNNRKPDSVILQRLDRALASVSWCSCYPDAKLFHLPRSNSDHCPILLRLKPEIKRERKNFKFENWWLYRPNFREVCEGAVRNTEQNWHSVTINLKKGVRKWLRKEKSPTTALSELEHQLSLVQSLSPSTETYALDRELQKSYNSHLLEVEAYWSQRATLKWALLGDSNTHFYHQSVAQRRRTNRISSVIVEEDVVITDESMVRRAFVNHYKEIYGSGVTRSSISFDSQFLRLLPKIPTHEAEYMAMRPTDQEITEAVFAISPDKASGPDGINARVVQTFWTEFAQSVLNEVHLFFETGHMDPHIASSNMVLIPKLDAPSRVTHYRPISVCNFMYKVISKVLCSRLKRVIGTLIFPNQTAFTPGRDISENIIVLREVMHSINTSNYVADSFCYKCDLSKAFDRMNWDFIFRVLAIYGFPGPYIEWIKACVTSARFSILFNGRADGFIEPKRGLRQGCSLSPYLFILCMDVLSRLLEFRASQGFITGIRIAQNAPRLTSIMFADDLIIFGEATVQQAMRTHETLDFFCQISGQRVGHEKSSIWFSRGTNLYQRQCIMRILNASVGEDSQIYLGVPVRASKPIHFDYLLNKVRRKINTWTARTLSQAGKVALIRSVIEPLIVFSTAGGPLPSTIASKIELMIRSFFWESGGKEKMHLISWDRITMHKRQGGLGLRKVEVLNGAMMLKTLWKIGCKEFEDTPWVQLLRAKYLSRKCLWLSGQPRNCTKLWRAIMHLRHYLKPHIKWQVGKGDKCMVYGEPWHDFWQALNPTSSRQRNLKLRDLSNSEGTSWAHDSLAGNLGVAMGLLITMLYPIPPMANNVRGDRLLYTPNASGSFSFKDACKLLQGATSPLPPMKSSVLKVIWHCPGLMPRVRLFLWKLINDGLPIHGTYASRLHQPVPTCQVCNQQPDLPLHALFRCAFAETFWFSSQLGMRMDCMPSDITELLFTMSQLLQGEKFVSFANLLWALWKSRCSFMYEGTCLTIASVSKLAEYYTRLSRLNTKFSIPKPLRNMWQLGQQYAEGGFSCCVDGSFSPPCSGGWAFVMHMNNILLRYEVKCGEAFSAFGTEVHALQMALHAALHIGMDTGTFFTDCLQLQQIIQGCINLDSVPWQDFNDTMNLLNMFRMHQGFICCYIPRENNLEAHQLANLARLDRVSYVNFTYPSFMFSHVTQLGCNLFLVQ
ncbi:reverse transcriptase [Rhynchospora pubera]|uniref:Reverse transcriptase n=1 Tax=Rhynchospora pubera TaxID=906938 RepID=A0AAV8G7B7_9POAL|nr:reverse transcriptase [Rhynchospora pubera]